MGEYDVAMLVATPYHPAVLSRRSFPVTVPLWWIAQTGCDEAQAVAAQWDVAPGMPWFATCDLEPSDKQGCRPVELEFEVGPFLMHHFESRKGGISEHSAR